MAHSYKLTCFFWVALKSNLYFYFLNVYNVTGFDLNKCVASSKSNYLLTITFTVQALSVNSVEQTETILEVTQKIFETKY